MENRQVKIRPIKIGKRATVGAHSCVLPDASLEDYATLDDMSLVSETITSLPVVVGEGGKGGQGCLQRGFFSGTQVSAASCWESIHKPLV